nr:hypothetical protein [uncultured Oscillibacter sp.]
MEQIFLPGKAIGRRNPDGFQVQSTQSWRKKMPQDGVLPFFKQGLISASLIPGFQPIKKGPPPNGGGFFALWQKKSGGRTGKKHPPIRSVGEWGAQPLIGLSIGPVTSCFLKSAVRGGFAGVWVIRGISNP